jgi:hypothetical protein
MPSCLKFPELCNGYILPENVFLLVLFDISFMGILTDEMPLHKDTLVYKIIMYTVCKKKEEVKQLCQSHLD